MRDSFSRYAWWFVGYLIAVILFGAWVRIAGAGAGCGNHWPLCNGDVVPTAPQTKTVIEFTHRVTSALSGLFGVALLTAAWRTGDRGLRLTAVATMVFLLLEGFIGAVLVKKELVVNDASVSRAVVIGLHLTNTLLLMASATAMAWVAKPPVVGLQNFGRGLLVIVMGAVVATSMTGAITALGDTLFPQQPALDGSLLAKIHEDFTAGQHFLVRLRIIHPFLALTTAAFLIGSLLVIQRWHPHDLPLRRLLMWPAWLTGLQVLVGAMNIVLAAPGWMQITHLLLAQLLWVSLCAGFLALESSQSL